MTHKGLRVLSYNIHKGFSLDRRFVLNAIKSAIQSTDADLVFLQEVIGRHDRHAERITDWPISSQLEFLADQVYPHFAYGKNAVYSGGHHGNAVISRQPFLSFENIDISNNRLERRGLLHATLAPLQRGGPEIHVVCLHLDLFERGRVQQYEKIIRRIQAHVPENNPLIIAGDFNDWRELASPILESELNVKEVFSTLTGKHALSFPAWFPFLPLDRMYVRGFRPHEAKCFVEKPWSQLSDHGAIYSVLEPVLEPVLEFGS